MCASACAMRMCACKHTYMHNSLFVSMNVYSAAAYLLVCKSRAGKLIKNKEARMKFVCR